MLVNKLTTLTIINTITINNTKITYFVTTVSKMHANFKKV